MQGEVLVITGSKSPNNPMSVLLEFLQKAGQKSYNLVEFEVYDIGQYEIDCLVRNQVNCLRLSDVHVDLKTTVRSDLNLRFFGSLEKLSTCQNLILNCCAELGLRFFTTINEFRSVGSIVSRVLLSTKATFSELDFSGGTKDTPREFLRIYRLFHFISFVESPKTLPTIQGIPLKAAVKVRAKH